MVEHKNYSSSNIDGKMMHSLNPDIRDVEQVNIQYI